MRTSADHRDRAHLVHVTTVPLSLRFLHGQVGSMRERGFHIEAVSSPGQELGCFAEREGITCHEIDMPRRVSPLRDLVAVARLSRLLRRIRPEIVHAHTPKGGLLGMVAATVAGVPVRVYHMRGLPYMTARGGRRALLRVTERVSCLLADRVFCVSHSLREVALRDGLCAAEKIVVLGGGSGNGVDASGQFDPDRFDTADRAAIRAGLGIDERDRVICFVGRIVRDKGIHELAEAWSEIRAVDGGAQLLMAGPFEPQDPIDPAVRRALERDPRVHLTGWREDAAELYAVSDVVTLPTYREGLPNVPLEAAAMGVPVVATRIPGCVDAVEDGVTGTLVPPGDAASLRDALLQYLGDRDLRARHGAAGRARVLREFRREMIWDSIHGEYQRLLRARGIAPTGAGEEPVAR